MPDVFFETTRPTIKGTFLHSHCFSTTKGKALPALLALTFLVLSVAGDVEAKGKRSKRNLESSKVCATFAPEPAKAILGPGLIIIPSTASPSCVFTLRVPDADALEKAHAKVMRDSIDLPIMALHPSIAARIRSIQGKQRYKQLKGDPVEDSISAKRSKVEMETRVFKEVHPHIKDTISVTHRGDSATVALAKSDAKQQKELLALQSTIKTLSAAGIDEAYYVVEHHSLIARKGRRVITVNISIKGKSDEDSKELLVTLAKKWLVQ